MSSPVGTALARVTIAAPRRRIDVALPEHVPLSELLPGLLRHAGEEVADEGEAHGGWLLRRPDGQALEAGRTLLAQSVRDGEVLHLVPRRTSWPELDYDDIVDAIATSADRHGLPWSDKATRICGLTVACLLFTVGLGVVGMSGPGWTYPGIASLGLGLLMVVIGIGISRALSDTVAGAILAALGLPYTFLGGFLVLGGDAPLLDLGAPQLLVGSSALLAASIAGYVGVADQSRLFVAGAATGLLGAVGGLLGLTGLTAAGAASIVVSIAIAFIPALPLFALRLGKLPVPELPRSSDDLLKDEPMPERARVFAAVVRSDELLTGMLTGVAATCACASAALFLEGGVAAPLLGSVVAIAFLLRSRLFPSIRQRIPLLASGLVGVTLLVIGLTLTFSPVTRMIAVLSGLVVVGALAVTAGLTYSRKAPSPYLGRIADILDALLVISMIPITCSVTGLFAYARGFFG